MTIPTPTRTWDEDREALGQATDLLAFANRFLPAGRACQITGTTIERCGGCQPCCAQFIEDWLALPDQRSRQTEGEPVTNLRGTR